MGVLINSWFVLSQKHTFSKLAHIKSPRIGLCRKPRNEGGSWTSFKLLKRAREGGDWGNNSAHLILGDPRLLIGVYFAASYFDGFHSYLELSVMKKNQRTKMPRQHKKKEAGRWGRRVRGREKGVIRRFVFYIKKPWRAYNPYKSKICSSQIMFQ